VAKSSQRIFLTVITLDQTLHVQNAAAKEPAKTAKGKLVLGKFSATFAVTAATGFLEGFDPTPPARDFTNLILNSFSY